MTLPPSQVRFLPFEGVHYEHGFRSGLKLLLLGESHYGEDRGAAMTRHWLRLHEEGETGNRSMTWTKCETLMSYCSNHDPRSLWERIAFANFVQISLEDQHCRPEPDHWKTGWDAFPELLTIVKPDVMLVLGKTVWDELPWDDRQPSAFQHHPELRTGDDQWGVVYARQDGGHTIAGFVYHPSHPGWSAKAWYPHVERLLSAAERIISGRNDSTLS
jgi:hypothetical protein